MARAKKITAVRTPEAPSDEVVCIEATEEIIETISELRRIEELKKKLYALEDNYKLKVTDFMGLHQQLKSGAFTLATWKTQSRKSFDASSFKAGFPDLYNSYQKEINLRVFRLC